MRCQPRYSDDRRADLIRCGKRRHGNDPAIIFRVYIRKRKLVSPHPIGICRASIDNRTLFANSYPSNEQNTIPTARLTTNNVPYHPLTTPPIKIDNFQYLTMISIRPHGRVVNTSLKETSSFLLYTEQKVLLPILLF